MAADESRETAIKSAAAKRAAAGGSKSQPPTDRSAEPKSTA